MHWKDLNTTLWRDWDGESRNYWVSEKYWVIMVELIWRMSEWERKNFREFGDGLDESGFGYELRFDVMEVFMRL